MNVSKISIKGQITIPLNIRKTMDIRPGDLIIYELEGKAVKLKKIEPFMVIVSRSGIMKKYTAVIERCPETSLYAGYIPGFPGAHSQAETLDELNRNLKEVDY